MIINHNLSALNTFNALTNNQNAQASSMEKLSTGLKINRAADDAAGLGISQKMQEQINGLTQAQSNAQDGISLIQTADSGLSVTQSMLQRMNTLTVQAANGTLTSSDTSKIQAEINQLSSQIDSIAGQTQYNTQNILNTTANMTFQVGANGGQTITMSLVDATASALGIGNNATTSGLADLSSFPSTSTLNEVASANLQIIQSAIDAISNDRSNLGAVENRLNYTITNLQSSSQNLTSAESNITDVNMAQEMSNFTKNQILTQAATSMLAQANQMPQSVLKLLG